MKDSSIFRRTGIKRVWYAVLYSIQGLTSAIKNESAFRQEFCVALVMIPLALWLAPGFVERSLLVGCLFLVMIVELLNSAIETAIDYQSTEIHPLAKLAKDFGSAAVMLSLLNVIFIWGLFLGNYVIQ